MKKKIKSLHVAILHQWAGISALGVGVVFLGLSLAISLSDVPATENINPRNVSEFGIYGDPIGLDGFIEYPEGVERTLGDWSVRAIPGDSWTVTINWLAFDSEDLPIDISAPKSVFIQLPPDARMVQGVQTLEATQNACAAWRSAEGNGTANPEIIVSPNNIPWVVCTIPAVGRVQSLVFEMTFEWQSQARGSSGIGRIRDAIRFPTIPWNAPNFQQDLANQSHLPSLALLQPLEFTIESSSNEKIVEVFPDPNGGGVGKRSWEFSYRDPSPEIEFISQSETARWWIKPATDTLLLLGGAALGLITAFWRKRTA